MEYQHQGGRIMKRNHLVIISLLTVLTLMLSVSVVVCQAAPAISSHSGTVAHGNSLTISGSGFGAKTVAAPVVWDDCSGTSITSKWSGYWPNAGNASYQMAYRTPVRGVALPHSRITKYMAGAHGDNSGANAGYNVMVWKTLTGVTYPKYVYFSAYVRQDPAWVFGGDDNFKNFDFSNGASPYTMNGSTDSNWYVEYNGRFTSATSGGSWHLNDDGGTLSNPDAAGQSWWWSGAVNPFQQWIKQEYEIKITNQNDGYIKVWENGVQKVNYIGPTDKYTGSTKAIAIGGYARNYGQPNNWRYFADLYFDTTPQRVMICNGSTYSNRGLCEVQVPSAWSATSITTTVNAGALSGTKFLYVVDSTGAVNSSGYSVTFGSTGGGGGTKIPSAPIAQ